MQAVSLSMDLEPMTLAGEVLPGHRLIARLGRGGFAEVWEAEAPGGFRVALKFVRLSARSRPRELRAIEILRDIRHPNVLANFGAWQVEDLLIIGMELAERSLWDRFLEARTQQMRGIPRQELLGYLADSAAGIDYLNGAQHTVGGRAGVGIQHRDLKPQNILLFGRGAKVADFGVSRIMERDVASHTGLWTLAYAAPEFFHGRTSHRSDQYSLAVTYCQLRGGRLPYRGATAEIAAGHMFLPPDLEGLPEPERPIVARALSKQPEERWPDCRSFVAALHELGNTGRVAIPDVLSAPLDDEESAFPRSGDRCGSDDATPLQHESDPFTSGCQGSPSFLFDSTRGRTDAHGAEGPVSPVRSPARIRARGTRLSRATLLLTSGIALLTLAARLPDGRARPVSSRVVMAERGVVSHRAAVQRIQEPAIATGPDLPSEAAEVRQAREEPPASSAEIESSPDRPGIELIEVANLSEDQNQPAPSRPAYERGRVHLLHGAYPEAISAFTEAIRLDPSLAMAYFSRGQAYHLCRRYRDALDDYSAALPYRPSDADIYVLRGRVHQELGSPDLALADYAEAIRLRPDDVNIYMARGRIYHERGQYDLALADYTAVIRLRPDDLAAHYRRGLVRYHSGDNRGAIADFSVVIRLDRRHANAYRFRSEAYARSGNGACAGADHDDFDQLVLGHAPLDPARRPATGTGTGPGQPRVKPGGGPPLKDKTPQGTPTAHR